MICGGHECSELTLGAGKFPEPHEISNLGRACDPRRVTELLRLLHVAAAEQSALAATPTLRLADYAVDGMVGTFRDWDTLGVHRPIIRLSTGADLTDRAAAGELPVYVLRETALDPDPATGLRVALAAAAAGTGPPARLALITGESSAGKTSPRWLE